MPRFWPDTVLLFVQIILVLHYTLPQPCAGQIPIGKRLGIGELTPVCLQHWEISPPPPLESGLGDRLAEYTCVFCHVNHDKFIALCAAKYHCISINFLVSRFFIVNPLIFQFRGFCWLSVAVLKLIIHVCLLYSWFYTNLTIA